MRRLIVDDAATGSFDQELAAGGAPADAFFARLARALDEGFLPIADPEHDAEARVPVVGYVYAPAGATLPLGFAVVKQFPLGCYELWLAGIAPAHRGQGHGRRMLGALLHSAAGPATQVARCNLASGYCVAMTRVLTAVGFAVIRQTPQLRWFVRADAPAWMAQAIATAPLRPA